MNLFEIETRLFALAIALMIFLTGSNAESLPLRADSLQPEIGKPMPDFVLFNIAHKRGRASSSDFRGKWLFLDFWTTGCIACIESFPKASEIQKEFRGQLNWVLVGINGSGSRGIERIYEKFRAKRDLQMTSAYDSTLVNQWTMDGFPQIYIIDPDGILRYMTDGRDLTRDKVRALVNGEKSVSLYPKMRVFKDFDVRTVPENAKTKERKFIYRSMVTEWEGENQAMWDVDQYVRRPYSRAYKDGLSITMIPLSYLYNNAYFGKCYLKYPLDSLYAKVFPSPVLEIRDTSLFEFDFRRVDIKGAYNYNLTIPPKEATRENIMRLMQEDLRRAFKYTASVEDREMPVWELVAKPGAADKLKTKGGVEYNSEDVESTVAGFTIRNLPVRRLMFSIMNYIAKEQTIPFVDGSNIHTNIDILLDADMTDWADIRKALQKNGLDLVEGSRKMKVLVIRN